MATNGVPLNPENLLQVLQAAISSDPGMVQLATKQLRGWEMTPGYWSLLQDAYLDMSLQRDVRWISIITLKYGVDRFWRKTAQNSFGKEEKDKVRSRLLESINEPDHQLALQNAVIVGKIARNEYPLDWPDIFSRLLDVIRASAPPVDESQLSPGQQPSTLRLQRSLSILLHVVKELCTGRIPRIRSNLQTASPELFRVIAGIYVQYVEHWTHGIEAKSHPDEWIHERLNISLSCMKVLRRLVVSGFEFANRSEEIKQFWSIINEQWNLFTNLTTPTAQVVDVNKNLISRHIVGFGKLYIELAQGQAAAFGLMPDVLVILQNYWHVIDSYGDALTLGGQQTLRRAATNQLKPGSSEDKASFIEKIALQGMRLYRSCIQFVFKPTMTFKYRHKEEKGEIQQATEFMKTQVLTLELVTKFMEVLVTKYFILRQDDMESWEEDPESWAINWDDQSESWEFMIRPCAEKLYMDFVVHFKHDLAVPIVGVFNNVAKVENQDILIKEAVYNAIGLVPGILEPHLDFNSFLINVLSNEVQINQPEYRILRRRIPIIIGQWVTVNVDPKNRPLIFKITQHLLNKNDPLNDLCVRITAARALKYSVNDWQFRVEGFVEYADDLFEKIMALIDEVEETPTKMALVDVIGSIAEAMSHNIAPYAHRVISILPALWEETGEEHLFKQSILSILTKIILCMKDASVQYQEMCINLIQYSVTPENGLFVFLFEDALELWDAVVGSTPASHAAPLLTLVPLLLPTLDMDTSRNRRVLEVIEGYVLLAPQEMLTTYSPALFNIFGGLLGKGLKQEASEVITDAIEMIIRTAAAVQGDEGMNALGQILVDSGVAGKIFEGIYQSWEAHQTTGPNKQYSEVDPIVLTHYYVILSRVILGSLNVFAGLLKFVEGQEVQRNGGSPPKVGVTKWLIEEWFYHFGNISHPRHRKLNCLALTKLLELNEEWILFRMQDLMTVWTDVVGDLMEDGKDSLLYDIQPERSLPQSAETSRRKELTNTDPVHSVDISQWVKHYLLQTQSLHGPEAFKANYVDIVDKDVLADFMKLNMF